MILTINLDGNNIKLTIKNGKKIIAESSWSDEYSLSEKLLPNIDALLKRNIPSHPIGRRGGKSNSKCIGCGGGEITKQKIIKVIPKISKTSGVTSSRIVQTVAKAWNSN